MQAEAPASLVIGTQVSAKYKGAFCEATVRSVDKLVKVKVTFRNGLGHTTLSDEYVRSEGPIQVGSTVKARHPDKQEYVDAVVNKIQDQSQYTVVFDDGDITTLRRSALCMKSGKHFNASESLDNLPLTHPEHFSSPVAGASGSGSRGRRKGAAESDDDDDSSSAGEGDGDSVPSSYRLNIGRVVCVENPDKKGKAKEPWFPALIVSPSAASSSGKIDTKEDFLVRSFKDGRYYTVSKTDTTKFHQNAIKKPENAHLKDALEKALSYILNEELPPHWERDNLFNMPDDSTTESSETESLEDFDDEESPEERDHLVADLYKHMEERGTPINKTPTIGNKELDLYKLFKIVLRMGGCQRVTNNNSWRQVGLKLGFETTWCINQVRVHYMRYLKSYEDMNKHLGVTMKLAPTSTSRSRRSSGTAINRAVMRSKPRSGSSGRQAEQQQQQGEAESDKSSIGSAQEDKQPDSLVPASSSDKKSEEVKEEADERRKGGKGGKQKTPTRPDAKMTTRPRRDSTSSLAAAMQVKAQKDNIGEDSRRPVVRMDRDKETENEARKLKAKSPKMEKAAASTTAAPASSPTEPVAKDSGKRRDDSREKKEEKKEPSVPPPEPPEKVVEKMDRDKKEGKFPGGKKKLVKKKAKEEDVAEPVLPPEDPEAKQHLPPNVEVALGDKIKVFYKLNTIYEAKVIKVQTKPDERWPRYLVHYQGWNARYDEWIRRSKIAENMSWSKDREHAKPIHGHPEQAPVTPTISEAWTTKKDEKKEPSTSVKDKTVTRGTKGGKVSATAPTKPVETPKTPSAASGSSTTSQPAVTPSRSRTGSPALKRQSSRTSVKKESEESGGDDDSSVEDVRKSSRLNQKPTPSMPGAGSTDSGSSSTRRSSRKRLHKDESETDDVDVEKDESVSPTKPKRGKRGAKSEEEEKDPPVAVKEEPSSSPTRPSTRVGSRERAATRQSTTASTSAPAKGKETRRGKRSEDESGEEDPYAFKEPEPFDDKGKAQQGSTKAEEVKKKPASSPSTSTRAKRESDSTDSSSDEAAKRTRSNRSTRGNKDKASDDGGGSDTKTEEETSVKEEEGGAESDSLEAPKEEPVKEEEAREDTEEDVEDSEKAGKSLLHMTKKQRELFPFLSAIKTTTVENLSNRSNTRSSTASAQASKAQEKSREKSPLPTAAVPKSRSRSHSPSNVEPKSTPAPSSLTKAYPRRGGKRRKPKTKSSELVGSESESEVNSDDDSAHPKTRRGAESSSSQGSQSKRRHEQEAEDESAKKSAAKKPRREDQEDLDLECGETIPGSPVHPSSGTAEATSPSTSKPAKPPVSTATTAAVGGRLEMPFATVPDGPKEQGASRAGSTTSSTSAIPATLPPRRTYPPAARATGAGTDADEDALDDSSASQSPKPAVARGDGSKSPADSSEVDMESVNGRKAESEDSKLDVEAESAIAASKKSVNSRKRAAPTPNSPASIAKRKRRPREAALRGAARAGRGRHGSSRFGKGAGHDDETDESEDHRDPSFANLENLSNEQFRSLTENFYKTAKNKSFFVPFDPSVLGDSERITAIQTSIDSLRKFYIGRKRESVMLDRRRKKIRRKERSAHNSGSNESSSNNTDSDRKSAISSSSAHAAAESAKDGGGSKADGAAGDASAVAAAATVKEGSAT